ncbi:hypothetical protein, partial [Phenylobacterium sp. LjRoot225]|uniref:hypothetical protein n=1 Tax=Phenylobacterium sp. LjRoot225 TaxID=3342285 RepID=UPI003F5059C6
GAPLDTPHEPGREPAEGLDRRFNVRPEYCGYRARRYVARFCGEWIGEARTRSEARALARSWREHRF